MSYSIDVHSIPLWTPGQPSQYMLITVAILSSKIAITRIAIKQWSWWCYYFYYCNSESEHLSPHLRTWKQSLD